MEENKLSLATSIQLSLTSDPDRPEAGKKRSRMAKGLRRALLKHQAKAYKHDRAKALQAAKQQQAKQRAAGSKPRNKKTLKGNSKYIVPFNQEDTILLLGEGTVSTLATKTRPMTKVGQAGDFSFALSLISVHQLPPSNITATAFDSELECYAKYEWSKATIHHLRQKGVTTLFGVDATKLEATKKLRGKTWTKIVWNFPHAGAAARVGLDSTSIILILCRKGNYGPGPEHP